MRIVFRVVAAAFVALTLTGAAFAQTKPLSATEFRDRVVQEILTLEPGARVEIRDALGVTVTGADGEPMHANFDRGYSDYLVVR